jgi:hypothetical protein
MNSGRRALFLVFGSATLSFSSAVLYRLVHELLCGEYSFTLNPEGLTLNRLHHALSAPRLPLQRLKDDSLEDESHNPDDGEAGQHNIGVEEFLGIKDDPTEALGGGRDHFAADHCDPCPGESLAKSCDNEWECAGQDYLLEENLLDEGCCQFYGGDQCASHARADLLAGIQSRSRR